MLKISSVQTKAFDAGEERVFAAEVAAFLKQELCKLAAPHPEEALVERVLADLPTARRYGVKANADLAKWCYLSLVAGPGFHEAPDVHAFLLERLLLPSTKMDMLMRSLAVAVEKAKGGPS